VRLGPFDVSRCDVELRARQAATSLYRPSFGLSIQEALPFASTGSLYFPLVMYLHSLGLFATSSVSLISSTDPVALAS